jgi:hypothetical protein
MGDHYETWHRERGNAEYRITLTMDRYGTDEAAAEALLDGMLEKCPEVGPVVSQDVNADTISVTLSLHADGPERAVELALVALQNGGSASGLKPPELLRVEIESLERDGPVTEEREALTA